MRLWANVDLRCETIKGDKVLKPSYRQNKVADIKADNFAGEYVKTSGDYYILNHPGLGEVYVMTQFVEFR